MTSSFYNIVHFQENLDSYSKCYRYAVNWTDILEVNYYDIDKPNETWPYQKCDYGWEYNTSVVWSSIVIDVSKTGKCQKQFKESQIIFNNN